MASLQTYLEAAKSAILAGAYDRGILICHHVLQYYPKDIEAHCLLGEAYREKGQLQQAESVFLRVLSADPENLIARWALSAVAEARGEPEAAVAHMQRAFDVNPRHAELRKELSRLSGRRAKLGSAGLARLYLQQGLTWPAIDELRSELARDQDRLDVRVALAEVLCSIGECNEAAALCGDILKDSPDCLKANIILGHLSLEQDGAASSTARELLERAEALDPENTTANELLPRLGMQPSLARQSIELPPMDGEEELVTFEETTEATAPEAPTDRATERVASADLKLEAAPASKMKAEPQETDRWAAPVETVEEGKADLVRAGAEPPMETAVGKVVERAGEGATELRRDTVPGTVREEREREEPSWLESFAPGPGVVESAARLVGALERESPKPDEEQIVAEFGEEWASLLTEDIQLDAESEARLQAALAEMKSTESLEPGWRETGSPLSAGLLEREASKDGEAGPSGTAPKPLAIEAGGVSDSVGVDASTESHATLLAEAVNHQEAGLVDQAVEEFSELLRVAPELAEEIAGRLKLVVQSRPAHGRAHRVLGDAYMKLGRFQLAIEEYNWVLKRGAEGQ